MKTLLWKYVLQFMAWWCFATAATTIVAEGVRFALNPADVNPAEQLGSMAFAAALLISWHGLQGLK